MPDWENPFDYSVYYRQSRKNKNRNMLIETRFVKYVSKSSKKKNIGLNSQEELILIISIFSTLIVLYVFSLSY